jgi:hypothetical protein
LHDVLRWSKWERSALGWRQFIDAAGECESAWHRRWWLAMCGPVKSGKMPNIWALIAVT